MGVTLRLVFLASPTVCTSIRGLWTNWTCKGCKTKITSFLSRTRCSVCSEFICKNCRKTQLDCKMVSVDWTSHVSESNGNKFHRNERTGDITWEEPPSCENTACKLCVTNGFGGGMICRTCFDKNRCKAPKGKDGCFKDRQPGTDRCSECTGRRRMPPRNHGRDSPV